MTSQTAERRARQTDVVVPAGEKAPQAQPADARSTASIAGHPLHPMLVPLPIGLLTAATVSDVAGMLSGDRFWARASRWLLRGALLSGATAGVLGATDFLTIGKARGSTGIAHAAGNATILGLSAASLAIRRGDRDRVPLAAAAISGMAAMLLLVTGWLGGELSYRHGIGVLPVDER